MKDTAFGYTVFIITIVMSTILLLSGCASPEKTMNFFTPDRFGYGIMDGQMNWKGSGDMTTIWNSDVGDIYWDVEGEQQSTMLYLEWDLPQWNESNYDKYLRDRVRVLSMQLETAHRQTQVTPEKSNDEEYLCSQYYVNLKEEEPND